MLQWSSGRRGLLDPSFSEALSRLLETHAFEQLSTGEVCLLFSALCLPAITDPTFVSRNALSRLKLEHADFLEAITLRKTIEDFNRSYPSIEEFLSAGAADPEEEFKKARTAARGDGRGSKMKTVSYHAATVVAHGLARNVEQAAERDAANLDAFIEALDTQFRLTKRTRI